MTGALTLTMPIPGPRRLWRSYNVGLERKPILTKALTSLVGFALGDAVAQFSGRPSNGDSSQMPWRYDYRRTLRLASYGGSIAGPLGHAWFGMLDAKIFPHIPRSPQAIVSKILVDQMIMTPIGTSLFFAFAKLMDHQPEAILPVLQEKLIPTCKASVKLWPLAHAVNFAFVPSSQRLLYINFISIFWTMLLSQASNPESANFEAVMSSPPQLVAVPVPEDETEVLASASFLDEMEALEREYEQN